MKFVANRRRRIRVYRGLLRISESLEVHAPLYINIIIIIVLITIYTLIQYGWTKGNVALKLH